VDFISYPSIGFGGQGQAAGLSRAYGNDLMQASRNFCGIEDGTLPKSIAHLDLNSSGFMSSGFMSTRIHVQRIH